MSFLYLKALHIIFVVTWFAGLFYMVRLFVYQAEVKSDSATRALIDHLKGAQRRLWYGITWPSAVLTWIFGLSVGYTLFGWDFPSWLMLKFLLVVLLTVYQIICHLMFLKFQREEISWSGGALRIWNEVATLFLVAIVFLVVLKDNLGWINGVLGLLAFAAALMAAIRIYKRIREKSDGGSAS